MKMIKLILAFLILFTQLFFLCPQEIFAEDIEVITVSAHSNLSGKSNMLLINKEGQLYILADNVAEAAGFTCGYSDGKVNFYRSTEVVTVDSFEYEGVPFVELEKTCDKLTTRVISYNGMLYFVGLHTTPYELIAITDEIMNSAIYKVIPFNNFQIGWAVVYSVIYGDSIFKKASGQDSAEKYASIMQDVVEYDNDNVLFSINKMLDPKIKFVKDILDGVEEIDDFKTRDDKGELIDLLLPVPNVSDPKGLSKIVRDPIAYLFEEELDIKIKGLGIKDQIKISQYMEAVYTCHALYPKMLEYVYYSPIANDPEQAVKNNYLPNASKGVVTDIVKAYKDNYKKLGSDYLVKEIETIGGSTIAYLADEYVTEAALGGYASLVKVVQAIESPVINTLTKWLAGYKPSEAYDAMQKSRLIENMQLGLQKMYPKVRSNRDTAINAKYIAMLYLRLFQVNANILFEDTPDYPEIAYLGDDPFDKLASIDDDDLTAEVHNAKINWEDLTAEEDGCCTITVINSSADRYHTLLLDNIIYELNVDNFPIEEGYIGDYCRYFFGNDYYNDVIIGDVEIGNTYEANINLQNKDYLDSVEMDYLGIHFGMTPSEVISILGTPSLYDNPSDFSSSMDYLNKRGCVIDYNDDTATCYNAEGDEYMMMFGVNSCLNATGCTFVPFWPTLDYYGFVVDDVFYQYSDTMNARKHKPELASQLGISPEELDKYYIEIKLRFMFDDMYLNTIEIYCGMSD